MGPLSVEINRKFYSTNEKGVLQIEEREIKSILVHTNFTDYEIYYVKNSNSNHFIVWIEEDSKKLENSFDYRSYFTDEVLKVSDGKIIYSGIELLKRVPELPKADSGVLPQVCNLAKRCRAITSTKRLKRGTRKAQALLLSDNGEFMYICG